MSADGGPPFYLGPLLGIVFDLDGTLVESDHDFVAMRREVIRIAEARGVPAGRLSVREPIPKTMDMALAELTNAGVSEGDRFRFEGEVNESIDRIELEALPRTRARRGAAPLLSALTEKGYRLAVLTRSSEAFCRAALTRTGLKDYFPTLRTRSAPGPAKPSPDSLLLLLGQMAVAPDRALFVGDHPYDADCATRARVRFLGVLPPAGGEPDLSQRLTKAGAIAVAPDLPGVGELLGVGPRTAAGTPAARVA
jgi:phosphoglycolate phosphatase